MAENVTATQAQQVSDPVEPEIELIVENVSENESTNTVSSTTTKEVKLKKKLSFKNLKSNVMKKLKTPTDQVVPADPSPSPVPSDTSEKSKKSRKKARSSSFMKRLTSGKVGPGKGKSDESLDSLKRGSPEGGNHSASETSLCEIEESDEIVKLKAELLPNDGQLEKDDDSALTHSNEMTTKASPTEDIQLQYDANANANNNELTTKDEGASVGEVVSSIILEGKEKSKRKPDESKKKTLSLPRLGKASTANSNSSKFSVSKTESGIVKPLIKAFEGESKVKREKSNSPKKERKATPKKEKSVKSATLKGNKKKSEKASIPVDIPKIDAEEKPEDDYMSAQESPEIEIEPKIVITTVRVQEANTPYQLGNSLKNPNLSSFKKPEDESIGATTDGVDEAKKDEIIFDIGTQVRAGRTSSFSASKELLRPDSPRTEDFTSLEAKASIDSSLGEGVRRRIAYVAQPTLLTADEEELLSKTQAARDKNLSLLDSSAVSDFTLDSTDYQENRMAPHGDLLDESKVSLPNMSAGNSEKREHLYKILVIGELGTGKTSFIKRYVHQFFSQNYRATIGVDFALKVLNWDQNTIIRLQLWDIAGQERFGNMTRVYYKEAVGAFIVFDVTRSATFDAVIKWKQDLDSKVQLPDGKPIPCILLANKCDQQKQGIVTTPAKLDEYVKEHGFAGWFETSAKENVNIEEAAKSLVNKMISIPQILVNDKLINSGELLDTDRFGLDGDRNDGDSKRSCAC